MLCQGKTRQTLPIQEWTPRMCSRGCSGARTCGRRGASSWPSPSWQQLQEDLVRQSGQALAPVPRLSPSPQYCAGLLMCPARRRGTWPRRTARRAVRLRADGRHLRRWFLRRKEQQTSLGLSRTRGHGVGLRLRQEAAEQRHLPPHPCALVVAKARRILDERLRALEALRHPDGTPVLRRGGAQRHRARLHPHFPARSCCAAGRTSRQPGARRDLSECPAGGD